jgi:uncharacterized membrane protein
MRIATVGHRAFAAILVVLGVQGLVKGDFTAVWAPVPKDTPARALLVHVSALVSSGCGVGLLWPRAATTAARVLLVALVTWFALFRIPVLVRAPGAAVTWEGCAETLVIVAAAWVLYASLASEWDRRLLGFATGARGVRVGRALYGLAMIPFGLAHFAYVSDTASLVPSWLPSHAAWVYLTGSTFLAAGAAILLGVRARLAAALSALQVGTFTLLVWAPVVVAGHPSAFQWSELAISAAITAGGWVVADSYRAA